MATKSWKVVSTVFVKVNVIGNAFVQLPVQLNAALAASALPLVTSEGTPPPAAKLAPKVVGAMFQLAETPVVNSS
jgi:hypothetical protein